MSKQTYIYKLSFFENEYTPKLTKCEFYCDHDPTRQEILAYFLSWCKITYVDYFYERLISFKFRKDYIDVNYTQKFEDENRFYFKVEKLPLSMSPKLESFLTDERSQIREIAKQCLTTSIN